MLRIDQRPERACNCLRGAVQHFLGGGIAWHAVKRQRSEFFVVQVVTAEVGVKPFVEGFSLDRWDENRWIDRRWHNG